MIRIAALNDSYSRDGSQSNVTLRGHSTKEAKEAEAYSLYNKALTLLRNGKTEEAEETFRDLIEHDFLVEAYELLEERSDSDNVIHPEFQLLYSIFKNLAAMATQKQDYRSAMESYLEAIKIDNSEVTVWFKIGQTALKIEDFQLAQLAFEQGLVCSPKHWPCLDNLITLMYALNNYFDCLYYIAKAFELDHYYEKGHALRNKMIKEQPSLKEDSSEFFQFCEAEILDYNLDSEVAKEYVEEALAIRRRKQELSKPPEPERLSFPPKLKAYSWKCVGEELIALYDKATTSDPIISICLKMRMPDYTNIPAGGEESEVQSSKVSSPDPPPHNMEIQDNEQMALDENNGEKINISSSEVKKQITESAEIALEADKHTENIMTDSAVSGSEEKKADAVDSGKNEIGSVENSAGVKQISETLEVRDKTSSNEQVKKEGKHLNTEDTQTKVEEPEDSEMVETDDSVLEAFRTAQTLLEGLSPCKDGYGSSDRKDSRDAVSGLASENNSRAKLDLEEELNEIEKELKVDKGKVKIPDSTNLNEQYAQHQKQSDIPGPLNSAVDQQSQKDSTLNKSASFGFTPSLFPEPSIHPPQSNLSPLATSPLKPVDSSLGSVSLATTRLISSLPIVGPSTVASPSLIPTPLTPTPIFPLLAASQLSRPLAVVTPMVASPSISLSGASPFVGGTPLASPSVVSLSSVSSFVGSSTVASPLVASSSVPAASPYAGPSSVVSPLVASQLFSPFSSPSPFVGPSSVASPLVASPSVVPLSAAPQLVGSSSLNSTDIIARTRVINQDHGYTFPAVKTIPVPNLQLSMGQSSVTSASPSNSLSGLPYSSSQSQPVKQNSGEFSPNVQTGSGTHSGGHKNIPVTQSLQKTCETSPAPSSLFIADFEDQSPVGRRGQKRKRISLATEEIMMYGKRRSARVRNTGRRKEEETISYMEILQTFLPSSLKDVKEAEEKEIEAKTPDQSKSPVSMETETEKVHSYQDWNEESEVKKFLHDNLTNCGLMILMRDYLHRVARFEKCKWEEGLADIYLAVFSRVRKHLSTPNIFCSDESQENIREFCKVSLLWAELQLDQWLMSRAKSQGSPGTSPKRNLDILHEEDLPYNYNEDIWYIMACCGQSDSLMEDWTEHCIRASWMKARLNMVRGNMEEAIFSFERTKEYLEIAAEEENIHEVFVANVKTDNVITQATVTALQESLQRTQSVEEIQRLSERGNNEKVVELLLQTFEQPKQKSKLLKVTVDVSERQSQLVLLQETLYKLGDLQKCLYWGEESFNESYQEYRKASLQSARSEWFKVMVKIFMTIQRVLEKDLSVVKALPSTKLVRFSQNLVQIIDANMSLHEAVTEMKIETVLPWVLLYHLIKHEEDQQESLQGKEQGGGDAEAEDVTPSLQMMNISHDCLGGRSWCCKSDGAFLTFFMRILKPKIFSESNLLDEYQQAFEQCVYCLYGHPNRKGKARHLQDHNAPGVTLQWEEAVDVFEYFKPKMMPEFDGYKHDTVSVEMECLLKRILPLIPESAKSMGLSADDIQNFIEGVSTSTPEIPEGREVTLPVVMEIYYLLGDYYLKNKEFGKAIKLYIQDLCVNPGRLDSWAGMALARMSQLEQKLSSVELKMDTPVFKRSITALRCFKRATEIDYSNCKLWIEYGSLAYILHSHASRQLRWKNWFAMKEDFLQIAKDSKEEMLQTAYNCFIKASECCDEGSEEDWIHNYMTGKCLEKMGKPAKEYLPYYVKAGESLHEGGAKYPKKIVYAYTTPHYAVEALEVYFRQHVSILKHLLKYPPDSPEHDYKVYLTFLIEASRSPFAKRMEYGQESRTDRDSASSADESSLASFPSPSKKKTTKYQIPSADHTYVRQKSNQGTTGGMFSDASEHSQSQNLSQDRVTLTTDMPSASSAPAMVTTLELHSEQTSSQEHEILTTTKCPEQVIDQNVSRPDFQKHELETSTGSQSVSENPVDIFMKSVNEVIDKAIKEEPDSAGKSERQAISVSMDTNISSVDIVDEKDNNTVMKQEPDDRGQRKESTDSDLSVIIIDTRDESTVKEEVTEHEESSAPLDQSATKIDEIKSRPVGDYTVDELIAMTMKKSPEKIHKDLLEMCFRGVELCLKRFPTHYKSHYRLAYIYFHSPYHRDLTKACTIMLGAQKWSQYDYMPCQGLFFERKPTKFFQGIWKIPIDEIDRSGSFPAHLNKCIALLLDILKQEKDVATLFQIHQHLNRQPEAGKKYLRDAERKYYTLQSFKGTLEAVEQQTNMMKLVTDSEARLKYLMTVYKIWEHGVHKLNRDVEKLNKLLAEAYRVTLRKLETLPAGMLLNEALRFCKHQQAKKSMGKDKNQSSVVSKLDTSDSVKTATASPELTEVSNGTKATLKNIIGPQKISHPVPKIPLSALSKSVTAAQKLVSLAKISKAGKSQTGFSKANKSNSTGASGVKALKINLTDISKGKQSIFKKTIGAAAKPKSNSQSTANDTAENKGDIIVLSDESERENSPTKTAATENIEQTQSTATPAPTVKIKMGLLQLAKLKQSKSQLDSKNPTEDEAVKENTEESESEAPVQEEMDISVDEESLLSSSSSSSTTSSSSSSSGSSESSSSDSEEDDSDDSNEDESDVSAFDGNKKAKMQYASSNMSALKKSNVTIPKAKVENEKYDEGSKATFAKKSNVTVPAVAKKSKLTIAKVFGSKSSDLKGPKATKPKVTEVKTAKANDTDDADDEAVTESDFDTDAVGDIVVLDDDSADNADDSDDKDYSASADDLDDDDDGNDNAKDEDVVMISESESEDEFAPKGRAIIPSPPHSKIKDMENEVLVSEMPDVDPIMSSIISSMMTDEN